MSPLRLRLRCFTCFLLGYVMESQAAFRQHMHTERPEHDLSGLPFATYIALDEVTSESTRNFTSGQNGGRPVFQRRPLSKRATRKMSAEYVVKRRTPMIWLHIHKAGGSLMCWLAQLAGERILEPSDGACNWLRHDAYLDSGKDKVKVSCDERVRQMHSQGSTWSQIERELGDSDRCWDDFHYGVSLREPVALLESMVNYRPGKFGGGPLNPDAFLHKLRQTLDQGQATHDSTQYPLWKYFDNIQTRLLAPCLEVPPGGINSTHVRRAKKTLAKFAIVSRLEDLPTTALSVFSKLGWNPHMKRHIGESVNARDHGYIFTAKQANWLREVNRHDRELWEAYAPP